MHFVATNNQNSVYLQLFGQLTFIDGGQFNDIMSLLSDKNTKTIELDFSHVNFIDSAGLGMLLMLRAECQKYNVSIVIHSVSGQVEQIFAISKFDQLFSISLLR